VNYRDQTKEKIQRFMWKLEREKLRREKERIPLQFKTLTMMTG